MLIQKKSEYVKLLPTLERLQNDTWKIEMKMREILRRSFVLRADRIP